MGRILSVVGLPLLLVGCGGGETGFQNTKDDATGAQGNGIAEITPAEVEITDMNWEEGVSSTAVIKVTNIGDAILQVYRYRLTDSADGIFYAEDAEALELSPDSSRELIVGATLNTIDQAFGEARIDTSDPDNLNVYVPLTATPRDWEDEGGDDTGDDDTGSDTGT